MDTIRVLVYGGIGDDACDYYRFGMFVRHLAPLGVEVVPWLPSVAYPSGYGSAFEAIRDGRAALDLSALESADAVVFSRWSNTAPACTECDLDCGSPDGLARHAAATGHASLGVDPVLRSIVLRLLGDARLRSRCAILYDLDDDLFHQPAWAGHAAGLRRELDLVELLLRAADLVTVSTPALAAAVAGYAPRVQVVRNAIEPELYAARDAAAVMPAVRDDETRLLFYGADVRTRDYAACRAAVERVKATRREVRSLWLGSTSAQVRRLVDEAHPYVPTGPAFAARLAGLRPAIGLAPLADEPFAACKSELHWLEYAAAGAATVASRLGSGGPYDVVRHGEDGYLATTRDDWRQALEALVASPDLRAAIAGRARERVVAEYSAALRASEWAAVYRWAAAHRGVGAFAA